MKRLSKSEQFEEWFRTKGVFIADDPNGRLEMARAAYNEGYERGYVDGDRRGAIRGYEDAKKGINYETT